MGTCVLIYSTQEFENLEVLELTILIVDDIYLNIIRLKLRTTVSIKSICTYPHFSTNLPFFIIIIIIRFYI